MNKQNNSFRKWIDKAVIVFLIAYGMHYFAYFIRARYLTWVQNLPLDEGIAHILLYFGHLFFLTGWLLYAEAIKEDRKYILSFCKGKFSDNLKNFLIGCLIGFVMMGICIAGAVIHGDISLQQTSSPNPLVFVFAAIGVMIQSSIEEIESRSFVFGKMFNEGVPFKYAMLISSFFFAYLHAANPGFSYLALLMLFSFGVLCVLCLRYFGNIWLPCGIHTMWNFSQDFIFGLPNSGKPSSISILSSTINGSGFFYDKEFGIEGCIMCLIVYLIACAVIVMIGKRIKNKGR